ncbi:ubiquinol-cytochrome c reductase complex ubiquinone-binding protein [Mollisia scopiformis]|uniref:Cytochrome b-c1 complex subunit 8 n=1 Tax=Mollisia scopiformis TaxID=149040 RepID=A0A194X0C7_MOLSC|nr:ubiquinol-cytochrome c reductase complex ubiquinone-binding protein [Mollisia scopiformis]KUJ13327.1 ubiquinol-cytochrome c reductase complex ubiquinone-binding protein [Mollisia scopiformis]
MRPSQIFRSGGSAEVGKYGKYLGGEWGALGSQTQKGVVSYGLSANRQRPLAGTLNAAIFNTWRRFRHQVLYFAPPLIIAYVTMEWAIERNEYLNSKAGRLEFGEEE